MMVFDAYHSELISKGILFTSSRDSLDETQRGVASIDTMDTPHDVESSLHISDKSNRTWVIPLAQCSTWFVSGIRFQCVTL